MRIAVLTNAPPGSGPGGAARIAAIYNDRFAAHGHDVRVWGPGATFARLAAMRPAARFAFHLFDLRPDPKTVRDVVDWNPDALLTHNLTGCGFGTPRDIRCAGVRWVHVLHDVQLFEPSGRMMRDGDPFRYAWRRTWALLRRRAMGNPDAVVSPTEWLLRMHESHGLFRDVPREVVPNPLSLEDVSVASLSRDPKQVLFVGRLDPDKGIDVLLSAWPRIKHLASRLVLIGDGLRLRDLRAVRDDSIDVRGPAAAPEVFRAMLESGVVAVPSLVHENQPTVILEALAACARVVATTVGGIPETLGNAGWLVEPGSAAALADGLRAALTEPDRKDRASEREDILRRHDPDAVSGRLMGLLASNA